DANRASGNKIALTGEGADELLAGYAWFKWNRRPTLLNSSGAPIQRLLRHAAMSWIIGGGDTRRPPYRAAHGVRFAQQMAWAVMGPSGERRYARRRSARPDGYSAGEELRFPAERIRRWHPLNQSLHAAFKVVLPGLLLHAKGDRAVRQASTEGR